MAEKAIQNEGETEMKAQWIRSLFAVVVIVLAAVAPCVAREKAEVRLSSTQSQNAPEAERKAKLKKVNRRFNKRYGKKVHPWPS